MEKPLVSVIMGVYNEEKTICQCIDSILNQTYTNWEFIICNDCSKDRTLGLLKEYAEKDSRIIVLNNDKNLRLAASLNKCLVVAKGKYVARMDADDISLPERIETQVAYMENHPDIDCVGCSRIMFDENGDRGIRKGIENPTREILKVRSPFAHPTIMMKAETYNELKGYAVSKDGMRAEDLELCIRFFMRNKKGYNIQKPLYKYHESDEDYKKRTLKAATGTSKIFFRGYRLLGFPIYVYPLALKPIVSVILPQRLIKEFHSYEEKRNFDTFYMSEK